MQRASDALNRAIGALNRAAENPTVVNTFLGAVFIGLSARSWAQDGTFWELEAQNKELLKTNKQMKDAIWQWKQTLYAEASANPQTALVPLSTLQSIYGDVVTPVPNSVEKEDDKQEKPPKMTFMV